MAKITANMTLSELHKINMDDIVEFLNTKTKADRDWLRDLVNTKYMMKRKHKDGTVDEREAYTTFTTVRRMFVEKYFPDKKPAKLTVMQKKLAKLKD